MTRIIAFFQKLFQTKKNKILLKNCARCGEFLSSAEHKANHDFLKHYEDGKDIPFEEKPLDVSKFLDLLIYSIEFQKHSDFYNFYNFDKCVENFFKNVQYKFQSNHKNSFKCSFYI